MNLYSISFKSLRRRKGKTFFLIFSLILAISAIASLIQISYLLNNNLENELDVFGANILIRPTDNALSLNYGGINFGNITYDKTGLNSNDLSMIDSIKNRKNLSTIAPKFFHAFKLNDKHVLFAGVDFNSEFKLKRWWEINGKNPVNRTETLIGANAAKRLNLFPGDTININNSKLIVSGLIKTTGSQDDDMIFANIGLVQQLAGKKDELSLIEISALCYDCPIEEIVRQTSEMIPNANVTSIKKTIKNKKTTVGKFKNLAAGISSLVVLISVLMVFSNVNASLLERRKEIGIYKSVGYSNLNILKIVIAEITIASLFAGLFGYLLGTLFSGVIYSFLTNSKEFLFVFNAPMLFLSVLLAVVVGIIASLAPAIRSSKLDPTVAFRNL
ncbi:macrolide export ATP-binding/permease protein MacB [bacterium BMS3Abin04]|nr:macrolide export ATP-binding/permease protein MacB [bacterium BMS3Abin04]